jgi:Tol biopolymer transport system component
MFLIVTCLVGVAEGQLHQTKIAFVSERDGNPEIYVMNADGSGLKRLTNCHARDCSPSWSLDGKKIAFQSDRDAINYYDIYVMNADGSEQTNLTNNSASNLTAHCAPSWSPDGKKIVFCSRIYTPVNRVQPIYTDVNYEICVMNADGSGLKKLTYSYAFDGSPSWSPDGKKIAFWSKRGGNPDVYIMNADGSERSNLTNNPAYEGPPSWSPDGKKIVFCSYRDKNREIYVMNADGSGQKRLTNNPAMDQRPSWSPFLPLDKEVKEKE